MAHSYEEFMRDVNKRRNLLTSSDTKSTTSVDFDRFRSDVEKRRFETDFGNWVQRRNNYLTSDDNKIGTGASLEKEENRLKNLYQLNFDKWGYGDDTSITDEFAKFDNYIATERYNYFADSMRKYVDKANTFQKNAQGRFSGPSVKDATRLQKQASAAKNTNNPLMPEPEFFVTSSGEIADRRQAEEVQKAAAGLPNSYVAPYRSGSDASEYLTQVQGDRDELDKSRQNLKALYSMYAKEWKKMGLTDEVINNIEGILSDDSAVSMDNIVKAAESDSEFWSKFNSEEEYKSKMAVVNGYKMYTGKTDFEENSREFTQDELDELFNSEYDNPANPDEVYVSDVSGKVSMLYGTDNGAHSWDANQLLSFLQDPRRITALELIAAENEGEKDSKEYSDKLKKVFGSEDAFSDYMKTHSENPLFYVNQQEAAIARYIYRTEDEDSMKNYLDIVCGDRFHDDRTWFQSGAFSDGFDIADIPRVILGTITDISTDLTAGALGIAEKTIDAGAYLVGGVADLFGADDFADDVKGFIADDIIHEDKVANVTNNLVGLGNLNKVINGDFDSLLDLTDGTAMEKNSVLGDKSDSLVQSGGELVARLALSTAGVPWWLTSGVTSFGGQAEQSFREGANYLEAGASGTIAAGAEILTEKLFGGSGLGEKGLINTEVLTKNIADKTVKLLADYGINVLSEGFEEVASSAFQRLGTALYKEENLKDMLLSEEAFDEYLESFIGGMVLGGVMNVGKGINSYKTGRDYHTGLTANEQAVVDKVYEDALKVKEADGKKLTSKEKKQLKADIIENMKHGQLDINDIESVLGGEEYKAYREYADSDDALKTELSDLQGMEYGKMNDLQHTRLNELKGMNLDDTTKRDDLRKKLNDKVFPQLKDSYLAESYNEIAKKGQAFKADLTKYKGKQREAVERAVQSGVLNDTYHSHVLVDTLSKIEADKGIVFDYTDNQKLRESGFALEGKTINGYVDKSTGAVNLNVQSAKSWQSVVGHEITHVLEGTDAYSALRDSLYAFAESRGELESRREALTKLYKDIDADIEAELTADLVGDYLFTNKDFITHLTTNTNLFKKIYDEIKYLCKVATGKQLTEIEKVKREFDKAWKELSAKPAESGQKNNTTESGVRYSFEGYAEDGKGKYKSNYPKGTPKKAKGERILQYIQDVWSKNPITLRIEKDGVTRYIEAQFDPDYDPSGNRLTDASKLMGGNRHGTSSEQRVTLDLADDYYKIASDAKYNYSKDETGKTISTHEDVREWHYFVNDIYFSEFESDEYYPYRVTINVKEKSNGHFVYSFSAEKQEETSSQRTLHAVVNGEITAKGNLSNTIVPNSNKDVKYSLSSKSEDIGPVGDFSTPLNSMYYGEDADTVDDIGPVKDMRGAETSVSDTEDIAPVTAENAITEAPVREDIAPVAEQEGTVETEREDEVSEKLTRSKLNSSIVENIRSKFSEKGFDLDRVLKKARNLSTFSTVDNTPQRVMEKALGYKEGQILADITVNKVAQNETEGIRWLNSFTDKKKGVLAQISKQYGIKSGSKESAAAQMYAEGFYVDDYGDIVSYGDKELAKDFPDTRIRNNIKGLAQDPRIRQIYDETLEAINESRTRNAYPEIPRLDNYFLHFRAMEDTFSRLGLPFNPNDIRAKDLPTDLNGVTADLKPGQPYFASSMHRKGKRTSFDLLGGLERYLTSAKNQIYHIDDIQTLRALRNYVADTYGQANGLEGLDALTEEEAQEKIKQVYNSHLSTFAKFLNEEANVLAGKTTLIDRGLEGIIGRRGIMFLDTVNKQAGSNMVGYNISSAMTNFLSVAQAAAKSNKFDFTKAFAQTVSNKFSSLFGKGDSFSENSPVIIRRKGAERFYRTPFQKAGDSGYVIASAVDNISTELIARTKYNELTRKGMDSQQAHFETDKWVSRLMGDRSLGQQPQLYNSKMLGIFTKFQLEVRNQLDSQFYDTIQEAKVSNEDIENKLQRNAKTAAKVASTFFQLAVAQHLFGKAFEAVAGYNPAFDIISVLATMFGFDDDEESEDTALDNVEQGFFELLEDLPYTSTFTGGRVPISSALPIEQFITGKDDYGNEKSRVETLAEAAPYYLLPGGYGQLKKTYQGLKMFNTDEEHPIAGSYTDSGNLRFPVEDTPMNRIQAGLFGQYASDNAREYFDNDYAPLNEKQIQEYMDVDLPISDYWKYREGLKGLKTNAEKADYINSLDIEDRQKNLLLNNILDRKEDVDMSDYNNFSDWEEFDYAQKYPEKYAVSKAVTNDFVSYRKYTSDLSDIKADKDENGKSISGSRKDKVIDYINNLDIDYGAKLILIKTEYPSDDSYNEDILDYLNEREDITYEEAATILKELGFKVVGDNVYWD